MFCFLAASCGVLDPQRDKISGDADWKIFDLVADLLARELKSSWIVTTPKRERLGF